MLFAQSEDRDSPNLEHIWSCDLVEVYIGWLRPSQSEKSQVSFHQLSHSMSWVSQFLVLQFHLYERHHEHYKCYLLPMFFSALWKALSLRHQLVKFSTLLPYWLHVLRAVFHWHTVDHHVIWRFFPWHPILATCTTDQNYISVRKVVRMKCLCHTTGLRYVPQHRKFYVFISQLNWIDATYVHKLNQYLKHLCYVHMKAISLHRRLKRHYDSQFCTQLLCMYRCKMQISPRD